MLNGSWRKDVHEFYTFECGVALSERLHGWKGGRLVIHICEMPIKCPVAPLEFAFLADSWLTARGLREKPRLFT
jgi:sulfide:quinone oxidoreductase